MLRMRAKNWTLFVGSMLMVVGMSGCGASGTGQDGEDDPREPNATIQAENETLTTTPPDTAVDAAVQTTTTVTAQSEATTTTTTAPVATTTTSTTAPPATVAPTTAPPTTYEVETVEPTVPGQQLIVTLSPDST